MGGETHVYLGSIFLAFPELQLHMHSRMVQRNMPYFKRIAQRRKLNPLAIGLKSRSNDDNNAIFYREILLRGFVNKLLLFDLCVMVLTDEKLKCLVFRPFT